MNWSELKTRTLQYKTHLIIGGSVLLLFLAGLSGWSLMGKNTVIKLNSTFTDTKVKSAEVLKMVAANVYKNDSTDAEKISAKARDLSLATGRAIGALGPLYREMSLAKVNPNKQTAKAKELATGGLPPELTQKLKLAGLKEAELVKLQENLTKTALTQNTLVSFQQANLSLYRLQVASSFLYLQAMANRQELSDNKPLALDVTEAAKVLTAANQLVNQLESPDFQWPDLGTRAKDLRMLAEKHLDKSPFNKHLGAMALASLQLENAAAAAQEGNESFALLQAAHWKTLLQELAKENKLAFSNLPRVAQVGMTDITGRVIGSYTDDYLEKISITVSGMAQIKTLPKKFSEENPLFAKEYASLKNVITVTNDLSGLFSNQDILADIRVYSTVYTDVYTLRETAVKKWTMTAQTKGAYNYKLTIDPTRKYRFKYQQPLFQVVYYPDHTTTSLTVGRSQIPDVTLPRINGFFLPDILAEKNLSPLNQVGEAQLLAGLTDRDDELVSGGASLITLSYTLDSFRGKLADALVNKEIYDATSPVLDEEELIIGLKNALNGYLKYPYQPNLKAAQTLLDNSVTVAFKTYLGALTPDSLKQDGNTVMGEVYIDNYRVNSMNFDRANLLVFYSYQTGQTNGAAGEVDSPANSGRYYKVFTLEKNNNKWLIADIKPYEPKPEEYKKEPQNFPYFQDTESSMVTLKLKPADLDNLEELLERTLKPKHPAMAGIRMDAGYDQRLVEFDKERLLVVNDYVTVLDKTFKNLATYKITARKYGPFWKLESLTPGAPPLNDFLARSLFFDFFTTVKTTKDYNSALSYTTGEAAGKVKKYRSGALKATSDPIFQLGDLDANNLTKVSANGKLFTYEIVTLQDPSSPFTFRIVFELSGDKYLIKSWQKVSQPKPPQSTEPVQPPAIPDQAEPPSPTNPGSGGSANPPEQSAVPGSEDNG